MKKTRLLLAIFATFLTINSVNALCVINEREDYGCCLSIPKIITSDCIEQGVKIVGDIDKKGDVDVFKFDSAFNPGDLFDIKIETNVDENIGVFTPEQETLIVDNYGNVYKGIQKGEVPLDIRQDYPYLYLAFTNSGEDKTGPYVLTITKEPERFQEPIPALIYLDFDGGTIDFRGEVQEVPPLEESFLNDQYPGKLDEIKQIITEKVKEDYSKHDLTVHTSDDGPNHEGGTQIYFGLYDPSLLGVAEGVDEYNENPTQDAIVFVETFEAFLKFEPTYDKMAQALANIASHEGGHILGLVHTQDTEEIMDTTAGGSDLLKNQKFKSSQIQDIIFPIGNQNANLLLCLTVGGRFCNTDARPVQEKFFKRSKIHESVISDPLYNYGGEPIYAEQDAPALLGNLTSPNF